MVTLVTQKVVDGDDPAFGDPTKFIGSVSAAEEANLVAKEHDWDFAQDGEGWRRVVAAPLPQRIVDSGTAELLLRSGVTVVLAGGGGIPVTESPAGLRSVEAAVDEDLVAAHAAADLDADLLVILTDVRAVMADFGTPRQRPTYDVSVSELEAVAFPAGSMGPGNPGRVSFRPCYGTPGSDWFLRGRGRRVRRSVWDPGTDNGDPQSARPRAYSRPGGRPDSRERPVPHRHPRRDPARHGARSRALTLLVHCALASAPEISARSGNVQGTANPTAPFSTQDQLFSPSTHRRSGSRGS